MNRAAHVHLQVSDYSSFRPSLALALRIAAADANAVVLGEPGVGKRSLAAHIHARSPRGAKPLVTLKCDGVGEEALDRALFGSDCDLRYTSGLFGDARGGTLLLEDVAALPLALQAKLVNALSMTGATHQLSGAPVRLLATSTRCLDELVARGAFLRDLAAVFACALEIPPIRARRPDALAILRAVWAEIGGGRELSPGALEVVRGHDWPGNALEIEGFAIRLALVASGDVVQREAAEAALHAVVHRAPSAPPPAPAQHATLPSLPADAIAGGVAEMGLRGFMQHIEDAIIDWALVQTGSRQAAAGVLGVKRTTLVEKLRRRALPGNDVERPKLAS